MAANKNAANRDGNTEQFKIHKCAFLGSNIGLRQAPQGAGAGFSFPFSGIVSAVTVTSVLKVNLRMRIMPKVAKFGRLYRSRNEFRFPRGDHSETDAAVSS